jgi:DNA-binding Lrp family transcriptional regulator
VQNENRIDSTDARLLLALTEQPRATTIALAEQTGLSRNTVQARLAGLEQRGALDSFERRVDPEALGYPLTAFVTTQVVQQARRRFRCP